jgi:hypothetical protein
MAFTGKRRVGETRRHGESGGDEAFHVAGAAPGDGLPVIHGLERIAGPGLPFDRHHVRVARQHDTAVDVRPDGGEQIGFGAGCVAGHLKTGAKCFEPLGAKIDQSEVGLRGNGRDPDERAEQGPRLFQFIPGHAASLPLASPRVPR